MSAILSEHEELTTEHESIMGRHDKLLGDMEASETKWRQKLQQTEEQCLLKLQQQNELVEQLRNENILTSTAFKVSNDRAYCVVGKFDGKKVLQTARLLTCDQCCSKTFFILFSYILQEQLKLAQQDHRKMEDNLRKQLIDKQILLDQFEEDAAKKEVDANLQERSQGEGMEQSELDSLTVSNEIISIFIYVIAMVTEVRQKQSGAITQ